MGVIGVVNLHGCDIETKRFKRLLKIYAEREYLSSSRKLHLLLYFW
jgi:hypothetical protein